MLRFPCLKSIATGLKRQNHFENDLKALRYGERWKANTPNPFGAPLAPPVHTLIFKNMNALFWTSQCCSLFSRTHCQYTSFKSSTILFPAKAVVRQREGVVILEYFHSILKRPPNLLHYIKQALSTWSSGLLCYTTDFCPPYCSQHISKSSIVNSRSMSS